MNSSISTSFKISPISGASSFTLSLKHTNSNATGTTTLTISSLLNFSIARLRLSSVIVDKSPLDTLEIKSLSPPANVCNISATSVNSFLNLNF